MKLIGPMVLLGLLSLGEGEVVTTFLASCPDFFIKDQNAQPVTPTVLSGPQYRHICQRYRNSYRFATLYDSQNKIPVYSAYQHTIYQPYKRRSWMVEPQLDGHTGREMTTEGSAGGPVGGNQAVNSDYTAPYQRGHLYPRCHTCALDQEQSTFTLTNAAPQTSKDNIQWYHQVEKLEQAVTAGCNQNTAYVVTGVTPGVVQVGNGVNVPSHYWSAYCCRDINNQNRFISQGYMLQMVGNGGAVANQPTVSALNTDLARKYGVPTFRVFGTIVGCS
ncbi:hypothetical protein ACEWY4_012641 [Coilia grayii]|uniref:Endonuclease domain-containing 1 protein-like n=1 Tax=Coilia grayii TaxID=363190 RepID=A0ABD1K141_9TELE